MNETKKDIALMYELLSKDFRRLSDDMSAMCKYMMDEYYLEQGRDNNAVEPKSSGRYPFRE